MYPVKLGFEEAIKRINSLSKNGHHSESLVTSIFTIEKTLRRTLKLLIVSSGFKSAIADKIIHNVKGLDAIKNTWEYYDPSHKKLLDIINQTDWKIVKDGAEMRNNLVHGVRVYGKIVCKEETKKILIALRNIKKSLETEYSYSGWTTIKIRKKSKLHVDCKVKTSH